MDLPSPMSLFCDALRITDEKWLGGGLFSQIDSFFGILDGLQGSGSLTQQLKLNTQFWNNQTQAKYVKNEIKNWGL